jgi:EmrB/QacA subfamily drug resistance transporter
MCLMKKSHKLTLLATIFGSGIVFLDATVVNLALPSISRDLGGGFSALQWIADGYLLSLSSLLLLGGSLGDILGQKKVYLAGLYGFGVASLICGFSPSISFLIFARLLQGIFGALLIPGSLAIINTNFPKENRAKAIGQWSAWAGSFTAIGPLAGGALIEASSWRWVFFINIPFIVACIILTTKYVEESKPNKNRKVDVQGALLAALGLGGITYGLIQGPVNHWNSSSIVPLVLGFIFLLAFLLVEHRSGDPMVQLGLFKSRNFSASNVMTFGMYGALSGFIFALVIYLQTKMGYSAIKAGASLLPVTLLMLALSGKMGALSAKYGPRLFMTVGPILAGIGILSLLDLQPGDGYFGFLLPRVLIFGLGLATTVAPLTTTVMASVSETSSGIASAINNEVSRVAGLIVVAVLGILGAEHVFKFSMVLCGILAMLAGVVSLLSISNSKIRVAPKKV